jgi:hypothetical protein
MAKNDIKAFANGDNANVLTQSEWEGLDALNNGFVSGKASSAQVNKALRQSSFMAAALAQSLVNSSGEDVLDDGDVDGLAARIAISGKGGLLNVQRFTAAGSYTYTPTPGTRSIVVDVIGAGGGGGGSIVDAASGGGYLGAGGGGGGYASSRLDDVPESESVIVGAAGTPGEGDFDGAPAGVGGLSSFGDISATGGGGAGASENLAYGGQPGIGSGGNTFNSRGGPGGNMQMLNSNLGATPGAGGASHYDGGGYGAPGGTGPGIDGINGSGGSGAQSYDAIYPGGSGGDGLVVVWEYS